MDYVSMFIWLVICLALGGTMHKLLRSAQNTGWFQWVAAPGIAVRKFGMALAAMATGATLTDANIYRISQRDIGFDDKAVGGLPRFLVPLAPLFFAAVMLQTVNAILGTPVDLNVATPVISSLSLSGAEDFFAEFWQMVTGLVRRVFRGDWGDLRFYVFLVFALSLSLGAGASFNKFRESLLGCLLLVVTLAVVCEIFRVPRSGLAKLAGTHPAVALLQSIHTFLFETAHLALVMMLCGIILATLIGVAVRMYELITRSSSSSARSDEKQTA